MRQNIPDYPLRVAFLYAVLFLFFSTLLAAGQPAGPFDAPITGAAFSSTAVPGRPGSGVDLPEAPKDCGFPLDYPAGGDGGSGSPERNRFRRATGELLSGSREIFYSRRSMHILLVGTDFTLLARPFDDDLYPKLRSGNPVFEAGNFMGSPTGAALALGTVWGLGFASRSDRLKHHAWGYTKALAYTAFVTRVLKVGVGRERPRSTAGESFPSGHASGGFVTAAYLDTVYGHKIGIPLYGLAAFIGYSRLAQGKHHVSDVVAGTTVGLIIGKALGRHHKKKWERKEREK